MRRWPADRRKVGELVGEIAAASQEQAQGIEQINKAVAEMDKVVQQNAANAEESASASEEMNAQAEQMKGFVGELVVMVSGANNGDEVFSRKVKRSKQKSAGQGSALNSRPLPAARKVLPAPLKKEKTKGTEGAFHHFADARPEQVIPLEGEFKEF